MFAFMLQLQKFSLHLLHIEIKFTALKIFTLDNTLLLGVSKNNNSQDIVMITIKLQNSSR